MLSETKTHAKQYFVPLMPLLIMAENIDIFSYHIAAFKGESLRVSAKNLICICTAVTTFPPRPAFDKSTLVMLKPYQNNHYTSPGNAFTFVKRLHLAFQ